MASQPENTNDALDQPGKRRVKCNSLISQRYHKDKNVVFGGAEGEVQKAEKRHIDLLDDERRQTGIIIK